MDWAVILSMVVSCFSATAFAFKDIFTSLFSNFLPRGILPRKDVRGKLVLITGAGNGLGRLTALRFSREGARLVLWDIDERGNKETGKMCEEAGAEVFTYTVDMSNRENIYETAEKTKKDAGEVDILINNAGILRDGGSFLDKNDVWIEKTVQVNMLAHMWMAKAFLPAMIESKSGHIVCICSLSGIVGANNLCDYSASKFGANGFQEALENEMWNDGHRGIHFTTVCPSYINTDMINHIKFLKKGKPTLSPDSVVEEIVDAILTEKRILLLPKDAYLLYAIKGLLPRRTFQRFLLWQLSKK